MPLHSNNRDAITDFGKFGPVTRTPAVTAHSAEKSTQNNDVTALPLHTPGLGRTVVLGPFATGCQRDHEDAERAALAAFRAADSSPDTYQPADPDPLRDGLVAGFHTHSMEMKR